MTSDSASGANANSKNVDDKKAGPAAGSGANPGGAREKGNQSSDSVGAALRSIYDNAVEEDVPAEFAELLGKLK